MRIAIAASEAAPFVKTGGLGDVMQALPLELSRIAHNEISVFLLQKPSFFILAMLWRALSKGSSTPISSSTTKF